MSIESNKNKGITFGYKSSSLTQETEASGPGPGTYNLNHSYESLHKSIEKTIGKAIRFLSKSNNNENLLLAPGLYNPKASNLKLPNITFTKSQRNTKNHTTASNIGPGSYETDKFWISRNNAIPFIDNENEEFLRILHNEVTPGPGSYEWKKSKNGSTVIYKINQMKKLKKSENNAGPGPGEYNPKATLNTKSIVFSKANKTFNLNEMGNNLNIAPNTYTIDPKTFDFLGKNRREITYSFSQSKRLPSLRKSNLNSQTTKNESEGEKLKGITFYKAERVMKFGDTEQSDIPGPGDYDLENYWTKTRKNPDVKEKMKEIIKNLKTKSISREKSKEFLEEKKKSSLKRNTSFKKKIKPFLKVLTQSSESLMRSMRKSIETISPSKKKPNNNPLKTYILKKIQKNVDKKLEKKLIKEIFILSNEAAKKRKNKGFTTSSRKYEFLNIQASALLPAPNKYEIRRDLNSSVLPLSTSKKITIFEQENDVPPPNLYNVNLDSPFQPKKHKEKNKNLIIALRKIEEIKKTKKSSKNNGY